MVPAFSETNFYFNGTITCDLHRPFMYQMHVLEKDPISDDEISKASFIRADRSPAPYQIKATADGDGLFNDWYEIKFLIYHDCGEKHMFTTANVGKFWIKEGDHFHTYNFDLTNKGIPYDW